MTVLSTRRLPLSQHTLHRHFARRSVECESSVQSSRAARQAEFEHVDRARSSELAGEGLVQQRLLQRLQRRELARVEGREALGFGPLIPFIKAVSPGLPSREATLGGTTDRTNPDGVESSRHPSDATPLGLEEMRAGVPKVARGAQPWAGGCNPVGIGSPPGPQSWPVTASLIPSAFHKMAEKPY